MAILSNLKGITVEILVDRAPLREYLPTADENDDNNNKITRYIIAESGKAFTVEVKRHRDFKLSGPVPDFCSSLYMDGQKMRSMILTRKEAPDYTLNFDGLHVKLSSDHWGRRDFIFSELIFDEKAAIPTSTKDIQAAKSMGEIRIELFRGTMGAVEIDARPASVKDAGKVHEKALKGRAISRQAGLTAALPITKPTYNNFKYYDKQPFATFVFRYRSLADLKSEMIVPRSPTPIPLEDRPIEELTLEEAQELLRRQQRQNASIKPEDRLRIKRERFEQSGADDDSEEPEVVQGPAKRPRVIPTTDLT